MISKIKDPLYKNSIFLMLSSVMGAGTGFVFWVLAAKIYPAEAVGLSSAMVSAMRLICILSMLGLNIAVVRFIPESDDEVALINSSMLVVLLTSLLLSTAFVLSIDFLAPSLKILSSGITPILFVVFTVMISVSNFVGQGVFVAFRRAEYTFVQSVASLLRLVLLPLLISLGALGVFVSFGSGMIVAFVLAMFLILRLVPYELRFTKAVKSLIGYAFGVYIARIFEMLPSLLLPIIVLNVLGAKMNAYFFIAWSVMFFTTMIARNTAMSLLAEGSHDRARLKDKAVGSLKFVFVLLFLAVGIVYVFGGSILRFFGKGYAENALSLLRILVIGCIPYSFNVIYAYSMMVVKNLRRVVAIYGGIAITTIVTGYALMLKFGLIGVGYAWVLANLLVSLGITLGIVSSKRATT